MSTPGTPRACRPFCHQLVVQVSVGKCDLDVEENNIDITHLNFKFCNSVYILICKFTFGFIITRAISIRLYQFSCFHLLK